MIKIDKFFFCSLILLLTFTLFIKCHKQKNLLNSESNQLFDIYIADFVPDWNDPTGPSLNELVLIKEPFLTVADITSYQWSNHHIKFPKPVHERLKTWGNLIHRIFVVVAQGERIYSGKFMDDLDSSDCQNPVIKLLCRHPDGRNTTPESLIIDRAYPEYFGSNDDADLRADHRIYNALVDAGVLIP